MKGSWNPQAFIESADSGRYVALLDNGQHTRAAHILKEGRDVSVLVVDSLRLNQPEQDYEDYAVSLKEDFGPGARLAFIPLDLQKSAYGCRVFSISLALKMHARADLFGQMHEALSRDADPAPGMPQMRDTPDEGAFVILQ
ncbi:YopJ family acetyltransferase, partial [Raoultella terrigena]|uniref:YopJ family acetyltransferase n=1 Tax=Raoultella terrigena TaxID=577 RepID=UPI00286E3B51